MRMIPRTVMTALVLNAGLLAPLTLASAADSPTAKMALAFKPVQADVDYEIPTAADAEKCTIKVERKGKSSGWVVYGPSGQVLRRFVDSNGDNVVDQWRYYNRGIEIYRDIDTNNNNKVDQSRWLTAEGTRWGLDTNEDGKLDQWKTLSAEEASREAVRALVAGDNRALGLILITKDDVTKLGIQGTLAEKVQAQTADAEKKLQKASASPLLTPKTKWMRFDSPMPSIIPADQDQLTEDLTIYENAMAIVDKDGKAAFVHVGELVKVGDVWKLTRVPEAVEGNAVQMAESGLFSATLEAGRPASETGSSPMETSAESQKLVARLQDLDKSPPTPTTGRAEVAKYNEERETILEQLVEAASTDEERERWQRQLIDGITASIQKANQAEGSEKLTKIETKIKQKSPKSKMLAYVTYQKMLAEYTHGLQESDNAKQAEIQQNFLKKLEQFVKNYPQGEDTPQACLQLAVTNEFSGKQQEALDWYRTLASKYGDSNEGKKAKGALARMDLKGKTLELKGAGLDGSNIDVAKLRGKVVVVFFWATWCKPCTEDLPQIRALYEQYRERGFEIVGVSLDSSKEEVGPYLTENKVTWPQIYEPGGLESPIATEFGIITVPTMFVLDKTGKVIHRGATTANVNEMLPALIKK